MLARSFKVGLAPELISLQLAITAMECRGSWFYDLLYHPKVVFFTNSGTEAHELAMMIARLYTGCQDIISLRNAYHGNAAGTMGATAMCNWKFNVVQNDVYSRVPAGYWC